MGCVRGKQPELRLPSGPGIEVPIENSERFWTLPSRGYEVGKGFKQKSHPTCDYLLLAFQIVRSQPEEILLICETLRLSGSHTLVATADLPVQELGKCGQPHGRVRTPPTVCTENQVNTQVNEWLIIGAQAKQRGTLKSHESKSTQREWPAGLKLGGFAPNSRCRDREPGLNAGYSGHPTFHWLQKH